MISTNRNLQEIYTNLWGPHNLPSLSEKIYVGLLLNEFTKSHGFSYIKVRMNSLMSSSFGYHKPKKLMEKHLDVYKLMEEESSLARHLKASVIKEVSISATRLFIHVKKMI